MHHGEDMVHVGRLFVAIMSYKQKQQAHTFQSRRSSPPDLVHRPEGRAPGQPTPFCPWSTETRAWIYNIACR